VSFFFFFFISRSLWVSLGSFLWDGWNEGEGGRRASPPLTRCYQRRDFRIFGLEGDEREGAKKPFLLIKKMNFKITIYHKDRTS